jgi:hypothetical protein
MPSDFSAIGFAVPDRGAIADLAIQATTAGRSIEAPSGRYVVWALGGGEQLWAQVDPGGGLMGLHPHFEGPSRIRVGIVTRIPDATHAMDGALSCWANPRDEQDPETGDYPLLVDVPDFEVAGTALRPPVAAWMQIAAFARSLRCWADDAAYEDGERERWPDAGTEERPVRGFAAESFVPSGMFTTDGAPATAHAIFTGHVLETDTRTNEHTGAVYLHVHVRTLGGEYDVVADPEVVKGEPVTGGVVQGTFWLSGRPVSAETPVERRRSRWFRRGTSGRSDTGP